MTTGIRSWIGVIMALADVVMMEKVLMTLPVSARQPSQIPAKAIISLSRRAMANGCFAV
jgi:hypothetical protein